MAYWGTPYREALCSNLSTDARNCGHCGLKCSEGDICVNSRCIDLDYDKHNCGTHGFECGHDEQ